MNFHCFSGTSREWSGTWVAAVGRKNFCLTASEFVALLTNCSRAWQDESLRRLKFRTQVLVPYSLLLHRAQDQRGTRQVVILVLHFSKPNRYEGCMPWLETPSHNTTIPIQVSYKDELELQHYFRLYSMLTTCTISVSTHIRGRNKYAQRFLSTHAKKFNPTEIRTSKGL